MDDRSERNLIGVHPDLVKVVRQTHADWTSTHDGINDLIVTEGIRSPARQAELVKAGASMTLNSRHLTGHAVDLACKIAGEIRWDWPPYHRLGQLMKANGRLLGVPIVWGGDWSYFRDGPHFELDRVHYPAPSTNGGQVEIVDKSA